MTPPSPVHEGTPKGRSLHLDRRRMVVLGAAGAFLGIAIVFGALAYFRTTPPADVKHISVPVTNTYTTLVTPPLSSPASGVTNVPSPITAVVTVTSTRIVDVPQASAGSDFGAIESGASTLATVVAAACAVIALRPQGRGRPLAPPTPPAAAAADAPAGTPT